MRLLASEVDTLNLAVWGVVREGALELLADVQERARLNDEPQVFSFPVTGRRFECRAYGQRGYTYWASCPSVGFGGLVVLMPIACFVSYRVGRFVGRRGG